jgi:hypothetical protein
MEVPARPDDSHIAELGKYSGFCISAENGSPPTRQDVWILRVRSFRAADSGVNFLTYRNHLMASAIRAVLLVCSSITGGFPMKTVLIPCPKCAQPGTYLKGLSHSSSVDYYRCDDCQHVWTVPKDEREPTTDAPVA